MTLSERIEQRIAAHEKTMAECSVEMEFPSTADDKCWRCDELQADTALLRSAQQEIERLQKFFTEIGKTLQTGGMDDPAFLTGAVQAAVAIDGERVAEIERLRTALEIVQKRQDELEGEVMNCDAESADYCSGAFNAVSRLRYDINKALKESPTP